MAETTLLRDGLSVAAKLDLLRELQADPEVVAALRARPPATAEHVLDQLPPRPWDGDGEPTGDDPFEDPRPRRREREEA